MPTSPNPLLSPAGAADPLALPAYASLLPSHFEPAFRAAMAAQRAEIEAIATDPAEPTFANTAEAIDRSGQQLEAVSNAFHSLTQSNTSPELQRVEREMAVPLAAHANTIVQDERLHRRLAALKVSPGWEEADAQARALVDRLLLDAERAGAALPPGARAEMAALVERHAELTTRFAQNVLHDESTWRLPLPDEASMAGLPDDLRAACEEAGRERGSAVPVVTLARSLLIPFLSSSTRRDLREQLWRAWVSRGEHPGEHDNRPLVRDILAVRREQARVMGHRHYAEFKLVDTMAGAPQQVWALLNEVWAKALPAQARERELLRRTMRDAGEGDAPLEAWDWRLWADRARRQHHAVDENALKPWFALPAMVNAAFECAERLYGLRIQPSPERHGWHADVVVNEVRDARSGALRGLFLQDNFARPTKRSGAWMSYLVGQHGNGHAQPPIVLNNNNFIKAPDGQPTLLSPDDVRTLFHEFGHGLHGLLSTGRYRRLTGTEVLRDFVELPSQLMEHWGEDAGVLERHARHWQTGEPLPAGTLDRLRAARRFGQGYETLRYTASAIVDLAIHEQTGPVDDPVAFEAALMRERGLPPEVGMNHRLPHFQHLFSGDAYAAGYYVYLWAEVLEADAFGAFEEAGDVFDPATAQRMHDEILSRGGSVDPAAAFRAFRGRDPEVAPMLKARGLVTA